MRLIYRILFKLTGWKIVGYDPTQLTQYVVIVAPHTSNWDFFVGLAVRSIKQMNTHYLAKQELFKPPLGGIFRALGGYPVDRSKSTNFVDAVAQLFHEHKQFSIAITPEGTRSYVPKWKTGFYFIAQKANVPIIMASLNYSSKTVEFKEPLYPSGNLDKDLEIILNYYKTIPGKYPEKGVR